jgi:hypothetical protein
MTLSTFLQTNHELDDYFDVVVLLTPELAEVFTETYNQHSVEGHTANPRELTDGRSILPATLFYTEGNPYAEFLTYLPTNFMNEAEIAYTEQINHLIPKSEE